MAEPINVTPNSGLEEVTLDVVDDMLMTPGVEIVLPNDDGVSVYKVTDDLTIEPVSKSSKEEK